MNVRCSFKKFKDEYLEGGRAEREGNGEWSKVCLGEKGMRSRMGEVGLGLEMKIREKGVRRE